MGWHDECWTGAPDDACTEAAGIDPIEVLHAVNLIRGARGMAPLSDLPFEGVPEDPYECLVARWTGVTALPPARPLPVRCVCTPAHRKLTGSWDPAQLPRHSETQRIPTERPFVASATYPWDAVIGRWRSPP